jgi:hypothetical protein
MRRLILLAFATLVLAGCASPAAAPPDRHLTLAERESAVLGPQLTLTYDGISDSRCPPDVKCIWAGKLSYQFRLTGAAGAESFSLGPDQPAYSAAALHGARIVLDLAAVPPARAAQASAATHPVTLKVIAP